MPDAKRRGNSEGSVYQEGARSPSGPTGRWIVQITIDGRKRRAFADSQAKAKRKLREMLGHLDNGKLVVDGNMTVGQLLEQWVVKALPNRGLERTTIELHLWCVKILTQDLGGKRIRNLTPDHIESAFQKRTTTGMTRASFIKLRSTLGIALAWAERRGLVIRNVARIVELPRDTRPKIEKPSMTAAQGQAFLKAIEDTPLEAMWKVMLYLGIRPGEAAALSWYDIDFEESVVHVRRSRKRIKGRMIIGKTKTTFSIRSLDAPPQVMAAFRKRQREQKVQRLAAGERWSNDDHLVFTNIVGKVTDPPRVRTEFARVATLADTGEGWTPNRLRHSAASLMSDAGIPLERIADQLGHRDTRMLSAHYRHRVRPTIDAAAILVNILEAG
jgi:integrase